MKNFGKGWRKKRGEISCEGTNLYFAVEMNIQPKNAEGEWVNRLQANPMCPHVARALGMGGQGFFHPSAGEDGRRVTGKDVTVIIDSSFLFKKPPL